MIERAQAQLGAHTWGELLARRQRVLDQSPFVGRRYEQEQFRLNYLYEVPQALLFVLQGPPGIGKTALLTRYRTIAAEHSALTAVVDRSSLTLPREFAILQIMETLADQLAAVNTPLTSFREVYREYIQAVRTIDVDSAAPGRVWDLFGGASDPDPWAQRAWDTYFTRTLPLRRSALVRDPVATLTERFVQDLNAWSVVRRVALCFDDWQPVDETRSVLGSPWRDLATWLPDLLCGGQLNTNIWFIVTTRFPLGARWERLAPVTRTFELEPLPTRDALALIQTASDQRPRPVDSPAHNNGGAKPIVSEAVAKAVVARAKGNPLSLALLTSRDPGLGEASLSDAECCVEPYIDGLKPIQQAALLKCTAARQLNEGVLAILLGEEAAREAWDWLTLSPVLARRMQPAESEAVYYLQPALRDTLIRLARAHIGPAWDAAHETLFGYYRQRLELSRVTSQYLDPQWRHDKLEALYHELVEGDVSLGVQHVLNSFLDGVQHFHPWAGAVVLTWLDAVHIRGLMPKPALESRAVVGLALAGTAYAAWTALTERRWDEALALVDELLTSDALAELSITGETYERLRALRNLIASRLALPLNEEAAVHEPEMVPAHAVAQTSSSRLPVSSSGRLAQSDAGSAPEKLAGGTASAAGSVMAVESLESRDGARVSGDSAALPAGAAGSGELRQVPDSCGLAVSVDDGDGSDEAAVELCSEANDRLKQRDYEAAIRGYDEALVLNPDYVAAYYNRGVAYNHIGALDGAIADFTRVLQLDPHQAQAHRQRGLIFARKGDYERAIEDYDAALAVINSAAATSGSGAGAVVYDRANAYFHLESYEQAIADYSVVLEHAPDHVEAHLNRGLAYAALGNYPEALRDFNHAIALAPNHAPCYHQRGQVYVRTGRYTEALKDYDRALDLDPRSAAVHNNRGLLYAKIEAYPEAVEAYQRAMALQPDWATPYYNAACAAALMQDTEHACIWLARAIGLREAYRAMALRDHDLASIRHTPQFQALVQSLG